MTTLRFWKAAALIAFIPAAAAHAQDPSTLRQAQGSVPALSSSKGQAFPSRPIRIIVASGAGGGTDIAGRNVAQAMSGQLRHPVIVENRPGMGSTTGTEYAAKATPDGYTVLVSSASSMVTNVILYKNLPYDPLRDFVAVGFISAFPFVLFARPDHPAANLAEFAAYAKERPAKLAYGSAGVGSLQHVWGQILFRSMGLELLHVPYKGAAGGRQDLMGGRIEVMFDNLSAVWQLVESGRVKGLAVSSTARSKLLPGVPTINETGAAKFEGESWTGMFAPARTPPATVRALRAIFAGVIRDPEFAARIEASGGRVLAIPPQQQQPFVRQEIERWSKLIRQYGVTAE